MSIVRYEYTGHGVEFDTTSDRVMINASEMAKIFDKRVENFMRIDSTQAFIKECLLDYNMSHFGFQTKDDLYQSSPKRGTWMHRVLALKFAAWLDPGFELWVYRTIDNIIYGEYRLLRREMRESAERRNRIQELEDILSEVPEYVELSNLALEERRAARKRAGLIRNQLELFRGARGE